MQTFDQGVRQRTMSDKEMLTDVLSSMKHMSTYYHQGILEANTHDTRQAFLNLHDHCLEQHKSAVETMKSPGWYQPQMAQPQNQRF